MAGDGEAHDESDEHRDNGPDQPCAQLDKVLDQRCAAGLDLVLEFFLLARCRFAQCSASPVAAATPEGDTFAITGIYVSGAPALQQAARPLAAARGLPVQDQVQENYLPRASGEATVWFADAAKIGQAWARLGLFGPFPDRPGSLAIVRKAANGAVSVQTRNVKINPRVTAAIERARQLSQVSRAAQFDRIRPHFNAPDQAGQMPSAACRSIPLRKAAE